MMIHTGWDIDIGMNRNSSDWLEINFNPILLLGLEELREETEIDY